MRIALVTEYYFPHLGGVTEHVYNLAKLLNQWGHPTTVITAHMAEPSHGADQEEDGDGPPDVLGGTSHTLKHGARLLATT